MANPKIIGAQRDFSAGELDEAVKRADEQSVMKTGARQLSNFRILQGGQAQNRPGRSALFIESGRVEEVLMSPGNVFFLAFGNGYVKVYNAAGTQVAISYVKGDGSTPIPWTTATAQSITFAVIAGIAPQVVIAYGHDFPRNVPQILTWDGVSQNSTWTLSTFTETIEADGRKDTIFTRLSPANITLLPSNNNGNISIYFSAPVLHQGMVGTRINWCGRQMTITGVTDSQHGFAYCNNTLPPSQVVAMSTVNGSFIPGDLVVGSLTGAQGIVISIAFGIGIFAGYANMTIQVIASATNGNVLFFSGGGTFESIVGPNGSGVMNYYGGYSQPNAVAVWDDEVMNLYRGYPTSVFYDQNRLGFCNFAAQQGGIAWSTIGLYSNFGVAPIGQAVNADSAIYEIVPQSSQALYVIPGVEGNEFVFCDNAIYWVPIGGVAGAPPLTAGSVAFNTLALQGCQPNVKPQAIGQSILYLRAGGASLGAVQTPGYYFRPNIVDNVSTMHSHLLTAAPVIALAVQIAPTPYEENYAYALRSDGVVLCAKFEMKSGLLDAGTDGKPKMGWLPWTGAGFVTWISGRGGDVVFTTTYAVTGNPWSNGFSNGFGGPPTGSVGIVEKLDTTQYLDMGIFVNNAPASFAPPGGKGPLWFVAGQTVQLIDLGTLFLSVYQVDSNGNIVPQFYAAENLSSPQLVAGQAWTATLEPFVPDAPPGQSANQRMSKRRVSRMTAYVSQSTGFNMARLFSGPITPTSPPLGTEMNFKRIPAWNQGDNPTLPPPQREGAYRWRPLGRSFDPRVAVIKDSPGPLLIHEIGVEVTV